MMLVTTDDWIRSAGRGSHANDEVQTVDVHNGYAFFS